MDINRLDFWLTTLSLLLTGYMIYSVMLGRRLPNRPRLPGKKRSVHYRYRGSRQRERVQTGVNVQTRVQERSRHQDAEEASVQRSDERSNVQDSVQHEPVNDTPASDDELRKITLAVTYKLQGSTKQEALERAFAVKKGGTDAWKRASRLFDTAMEGVQASKE